MSLAELGMVPGKVETIERTATYVNDPLAAFAQLCGEKPHALLLESAEIDSKDNLQSLLMVDGALRFECRGQQVTIKALSANGKGLLPLFSEHCPADLHCNTINEDEISLSCHADTANLDEDSRLKSTSVFDVLRMVIKQITPLRDHQHAVFLGGVFAYDLLATFEELPEVGEGGNDCADYVFYLAETLITFDHQTRQARLLGSVFSGSEVATSYFAIAQRLEALCSELQDLAPLDLSPVAINESTELKVDKSDEEYCNDVLTLKEHILAGDIFQVVPSRTFSLPCPAPLTAYAALKVQNPSPYMFYMQDAEFTIFGASPESAIKYTAETNVVEIYPIAGTRPRGKRPNGEIDHDMDSRIELDLREDQKEKAEHLMLVDLARNDVAKVSEPGTRYVKDLLKVDRYSHVMHLVSRVIGQLRHDLDALHAYQACMNMGTLSGAPKVSAATLIRKVEKQRRGSYGGAVGYLNNDGDMDTCIVIRSAFVKNGRAYIQAGAGVVYDSDPQAEANETRGKAQAVINAVKSSLVQGDA
ncbi:anthranilate synthase component 1 [Alteromonas lipolytica]|uniref:Anthranilate synthase component 1 n=1 Tax=Alteromonas lipolytica TaxID=1856405 RepID=A0A1E8FEJ1_9ALTE|nr:anthranilate synthase component 1 [Alteromonas lipolytica]OFI34340.1 anthranilate synthase component I [Alteromonas lipolytica]GGF82330.1 anthranilate synthase component 1 [Alteromonas lipolytica]